MSLDRAYRGRKVLVTGHTGFKGSWLSLWLQHLGAEVAGYSLDVPTCPANFDILGLDSVVCHRLGDIRDRQQLGRIMDDFRPDMVFHLAAQALVRRSYADPAATFETNVMGMVNVLECVRARPWIDSAVLITSDKAYQNREWCWGYRESDALAGHDPYSGSKSCADVAAQSYIRSFFRSAPTQLAVTRAGNVIGGGDWADDRIVPDCVRAWSAGDSVAIRSPRATRPWQHVLEPLSGYLWLGARLAAKQTGLHGEAFNFGPDGNVTQTVEELLHAMSERWPGVRWHVPEGCEQGGHEATLLRLCCDKAMFHLQWRPVLDFEETVGFTVEWYRRWAEGNASMLEFTRNQVQRYCDLAAQRGVVWAAP